MKSRTMLLVLTSVMVAGCAQIDGDKLRGTYTTSISHQDAPTLPTMAGPWEITFGEQGGYSVRRDGLLLIQGEYSVDGDTLRILKETGVAACTDQPPAVYSWKLAADSLTLLHVQETCAGRGVILSAKPLVRKK